ncbi:shikimate kinase [Cystobacter ferrugineus]|uniref:Shikimate kinase n=1 Tax=Cystobacter ferrugineus TaxID=83449 RepID=A0A1L9B006_9BACT|nr:shikimate kinase [Cystobacter ferrugineus]OJH35584.1 shikimate kinase [Cystobacter ferrugineus]
MSVPSAEQRKHLIEKILGAVDPRLTDSIREEFARLPPGTPPPAWRTIVIGGHRSAGKTRLLPLVSALTGRPGVDLDVELEKHSGRSLRDWVATDTDGFRRAERDLFLTLPAGGLVAVGGGFLSHHPEALRDCHTLLVPITFETYRERLLKDTRRPRLRPDVSLEEELSAIYEQREVLHARVPTVGIAAFLRAFADPENP